MLRARRACSCELDPLRAPPLDPRDARVRHETEHALACSRHLPGDAHGEPRHAAQVVGLIRAWESKIGDQGLARGLQPCAAPELPQPCVSSRRCQPYSAATRVAALAVRRSTRKAVSMTSPKMA